MKKLYILLCFVLTVFAEAGQVFYVSKSGNDANDGLSWATAFADVQTAIDAAAAVATDEVPAEVWIAAGTYKHGSAMTMKNNVEIYGGFVGTETAKKERIAGQNKTYLDGENSYRVFYNKYTSKDKLTSSAKLDNIAVRNGFSSIGAGMNSGGAGMHNYFASPVITNCTFSENTVYIESKDNGTGHNSPGGGGMYNYNSSPNLTNCIFIGNVVTALWGGAQGGGVLNRAINGSSTPGVNGTSKPVLRNCIFVNNEVNGFSYAVGGGISDAEINYLSTPKATLINCTFTGNKASVKEKSEYMYSQAGGCFSAEETTLINCIIWGNIEDRNAYIKTSSYTTCIVQSNESSIGIITDDPKLGELGDYGGNVQTIPVLAGSSAIGAGKVVEDVETDARGFARSATAPTIGAYEYAYGNPPYEKWVLDNNIPQNQSEPSATPRGDGIPNIEKFAFGLDASKPASYADSPYFSRTSDGSNLNLSFPVSVDAEGAVSVKAMKSTDLVNWVEAAATQTGTSQDGKFNLYKASAEIPAGGKIFLKLKVEE